jgi:hypothetical protein
MRAMSIVGDVLLAAGGFAVFIYGDITSHRSARVVGVVLVTLAFVAAALLRARGEPG